MTLFCDLGFNERLFLDNSLVFDDDQRKQLAKAFIKYGNETQRDTYEEGEQEITKTVYKLNRSINVARMAQMIGRDFRLEKNLTISTQMEFIKDHLSNHYGWLTEHQTKVIFAILLFLETMPYKAENDCCDDAYYFLLLPHLEEIIANMRLRFGLSAIPLWPFENLKKMFLIRLKMGFGIHGEKDISAEDLSLLARQNNLKSIQNAVSKKELLVIEGKGPSQRIDSQSARNWLTSKIKNKLIDFSWAIHGYWLNKRTKLDYLNDLKVHYYQIKSLDDFNYGWDDCPDKGIFQLIFIGHENKKNIYYGHAEENLKKKLEIYFTEELKKDHGNSVNGSYSNLLFHLLVYEPKSSSDIRISSGILLLIEKDLRKTVNYIDLNPID